MIPVKILLFSADAPTTQNISTCLTEAGYKVAHRSDGIGAIDIINAEKPSLIILDLELPGINSLAIIRLIRSEETFTRIPIILIGSNMHEEDILIGLEVGADLCLIEMFNPQVFIARVHSLLRRIELSKVFDLSKGC
jgi:two-component system alkaline phosphatase synthesis response regulator PhoP